MNKLIVGWTTLMAVAIGQRDYRLFNLDILTAQQEQDYQLESCDDSTKAIVNSRNVNPVPIIGKVTKRVKIHCKICEKNAKPPINWWRIPEKNNYRLNLTRANIYARAQIVPLDTHPNTKLNRISLGPNYTLIIKEVQFSDEGIYFCLPDERRSLVEKQFMEGCKINRKFQQCKKARAEYYVYTKTPTIPSKYNHTTKFYALLPTNALMKPVQFAPVAPDYFRLIKGAVSDKSYRLYYRETSHIKCSNKCEPDEFETTMLQCDVLSWTVNRTEYLDRVHRSIRLPCQSSIFRLEPEIFQRENYLETKRCPLDKCEGVTESKEVTYTAAEAFQQRESITKIIRARLGDPLELECKITLNESFVIWRNQSQIIGSGLRVKMSSNGSLIIDPVEAGDLKIYSCWMNGESVKVLYAVEMMNDELTPGETYVLYVYHVLLSHLVCIWLTFFYVLNKEFTQKTVRRVAVDNNAKDDKHSDVPEYLDYECKEYDYDYETYTYFTEENPLLMSINEENGYYEKAPIPANKKKLSKQKIRTKVRITPKEETIAKTAINNVAADLDILSSKVATSSVSKTVLNSENSKTKTKLQQDHLITKDTTEVFVENFESEKQEGLARKKFKNKIAGADTLLHSGKPLYMNENHMHSQIPAVSGYFNVEDTERKNHQTDLRLKNSYKKDDTNITLDDLVKENMPLAIVGLEEHNKPHIKGRIRKKKTKANDEQRDGMLSEK